MDAMTKTARLGHEILPPQDCASAGLVLSLLTLSHRSRFDRAPRRVGRVERDFLIHHRARSQLARLGDEISPVMAINSNGVMTFLPPGTPCTIAH